MKKQKPKILTAKRDKAIEYLRSALAESEADPIQEVIIITVKEDDYEVCYGHSYMPAAKVIGLLEVVKMMIFEKQCKKISK